jgi:hypothetical protein
LILLQVIIGYILKVNHHLFFKYISIHCLSLGDNAWFQDKNSQIFHLKYAGQFVDELSLAFIIFQFTYQSQIHHP